MSLTSDARPANSRFRRPGKSVRAGRTIRSRSRPFSLEAPLRTCCLLEAVAALALGGALSGRRVPEIGLLHHRKPITPSRSHTFTTALKNIRDGLKLGNAGR